MRVMQGQGFCPSGSHSPMGSQRENKELSLEDWPEAKQACPGSDGERNVALCPGPGGKLLTGGTILSQSEGSAKIQ